MTQPNEGGSGPANQGHSGGVPATLFTQDQVNHFNAQAKREALGGFFKELGFDTVPDANTVKDTLGKASEFDKLQDGQKNDVQRLTDQLSEANKKVERVPALEADLLRARIAADAGLKSKYWKFVDGKTEDEIKASVEDIKKDIRTDDGDQGQQPDDGPRPPAPVAQQGHGGGQPPTKTLAAGADAYRAKHKKE
jgi:hypothetical protein